MFRQDPAWTRSQQRHVSQSHQRPPIPPPPRERAPSTRKTTSHSSNIGSFEAELEKTSQMMSTSPEMNSGL